MVLILQQVKGMSIAENTLYLCFDKYLDRIYN